MWSLVAVWNLSGLKLKLLSLLGLGTGRRKVTYANSCLRQGGEQ